MIFGLVVGVLARLFVPGRQHLGWLATLAFGIGGSVIGGVIANALGTGDVFELNVLGPLAAIASAAVLTVAAERVMATTSR